MAAEIWQPPSSFRYPHVGHHLAHARRTPPDRDCIAYFGYGIFVVACPVLGRDRLGGASRGVLLLSVAAGTALLASGLMARWPPSWTAERTFVAATSVAGVAFAVIGLATIPALLVIGAALFGLADGPQLTSIFAIRQREAPQRLRSQIFTTAASLKLTAGALGAFAGGVLLNHGARSALLLAAGAQALAASLELRPVRSRRGT